MKNEKLYTINEKNEKVPFYNYNPQTKILRYLKNSKGEEKEIIIALEDMHVGIQHGNIKVGDELILNTLPGENFIHVKGVDITNVHGSCQGCCDGCEKFCYAIHGCQQHHNAVMPSVIKNLVIYREDRERFIAEIKAGLRKEMNKFEKRKDPKPNDKLICRWHSSGEIESYQYLEDMMMIAQEFPGIYFYSYTKRFMWIADYLDKYGDFPSNFCWNLSVWKDNLKKSGFPEKYLCKVQLFEWDDMDDDHLVGVPHCPGVEWDGKSKKGHLNHKPFGKDKPRTCANCGWCWKGLFKGKTIGVWNH